METKVGRGPQHDNPQRREGMCAFHEATEYTRQHMRRALSPGERARPSAAGPSRGYFGTAFSTALPSLMTTLNSTDEALACLSSSDTCLRSREATSS